MMERKRRTLDELQEVIATSDSAQARQRALEEVVERMMASRRRVTVQLPTKARLRFGVIGDTHLGSAYERIDVLEDYYANARARGITTVLHAGDVLDGHQVYRGQEFEVHRHGWEQQRAHFAASMPKHPNVRTLFITGNHDYSFRRLTGLEPGPGLAELRGDWEYIGADVGTVDLDAGQDRVFRVQLVHPGGGTAYALSYHAQKMVEALAGGTKPDLLVIGHYHKMEYIPSYRNVAVLQAGCVQDQTPHMQRLGLQAHVGGWFLEVEFRGREAGSMQIKAEALTYY